MSSSSEFFWLNSIRSSTVLIPFGFFSRLAKYCSSTSYNSGLVHRIRQRILLKITNLELRLEDQLLILAFEELFSVRKVSRIDDSSAKVLDDFDGSIERGDDIRIRRLILSRDAKA